MRYGLLEPLKEHLRPVRYTGTLNDVYTEDLSLSAQKCIAVAAADAGHRTDAGRTPSASGPAAWPWSFLPTASMLERTSGASARRWRTPYAKAVAPRDVGDEGGARQSLLMVPPLLQHPMPLLPTRCQCRGSYP
jgi:hypothetical protein